MKVLIIDDSPFVRGVVRSILNKRGIDVISAGSLKEGFEKLSEKPDLIILDINLPDGNGLEIVHRYEPSKIIVFSSEKRYILEALEMGVLDFLPKPKHPKDTMKIATLIDEIFLPKEEFPRRRSKKMEKPYKPEIIVVGASSGSPKTLIRLLSQYDTKIPILIALHIQPTFAEPFAERIKAKLIYPGRTTISKGKYLLFPITDYMFISKNVIESRDTNSNFKPSVDALFSSAGEKYKDKVLAIVLSGIGKDGQKGAKVIKNYGGKVIAQSRKSAPVWGMPSAVATISDALYDDDDLIDYLKNLDVLI